MVLFTVSTRKNEFIPGDHGHTCWWRLIERVPVLSDDCVCTTELSARLPGLIASFPLHQISKSFTGQVIDGRFVCTFKPTGEVVLIANLPVLPMSTHEQPAQHLTVSLNGEEEQATN